MAQYGSRTLGTASRCLEIEAASPGRGSPPPAQFNTCGSAPSSGGTVKEVPITKGSPVSVDARLMR